MIDYKGIILIREEFNMDNYYSAVGAGIGTAYYLFILVFYIACVIGMWKMFEKAGKPGWASLIPFYNLYCVYDIGWGTGWLFLLTLFLVLASSLISCFLSRWQKLTDRAQASASVFFS